LPQTVTELAIQWEKYDAHLTLCMVWTPLTEGPAVILNNTCTARWYF